VIEQETVSTMIRAPWTAIALCCAALAAAAPDARAQSGVEQVGSHNDWSVFVSASPKECYIVSQPKSSTARRDGQNVEVNRGEIRLFVRFNPADGIRNEVSFAGGYPFREGEAVKVEIGSDAFDLNPGQGSSGEWAWPQPDDDARIVAAMRRGSDAKITGVSARGTTTVDTFSLSGFTAAVNEAESRCK
jgi:hypothetical protein